MASCPKCSAEMDVTDAGPYSRVRCPACGEEVRVKTELGSYRLVRRIASGGMSVVFAARDPTLQREIAVKVLSDEFSSDEKREEEFRREARLTATVSNPHVVEVYTVGRAFGRCFIAMELIPGQSLDDHMALHGALPEDDVALLALQIVDGLRAAQSEGLIHRDIKPRNILIDEDGKAKIVDFGLSLLIEGQTVRSEEIWASPIYVAPEVLDHGEEDHRADIYALGATLYHALAGVPPVELQEITNRAARKAKLSVRPLKKVAPWLSNEMTRTVEQAMAHDPAERFEDYEDFRISLEMARVVLKKKGAREPVDGVIRAQRRERDYVRRRAWLMGIGAGLLLSLVVVSYFYLKLIQEGSEDPASKSGSLLVLDPENNPSVDPEVARFINEVYEGARRALGDEDFAGAEEQFLRVWRQEMAPTSTAAWAGFEAAVAAFMDGRGSDARQHLAALFDFINERGAEDTVLGRRLQSAAELLTSLRFLPEERIPEVLSDPFRATVFLAMSVKAWEQGEMERAHRMFVKLTEAGPWPDAEWMSTYQQLAVRYVEDFGRLGQVDYRIEGKTREDLQESIEALDEVHASLRTPGRARFNVKVWQSDLRSRLRYLGTDKVEDDWWDLRQQVATSYFSEARFDEGAELLRGIELKGELERSQRAALLLFCKEAAVFVEELKRFLEPGRQAVELKMRDGATYSQVIGWEGEGLVVEKDGAALLLGWKKIDPRSLLLIHRQLIDSSTNEGAKAARLLQAASFAWLNGLKGQANGMARELIGLRPEFEVQWEQVAQDFGGENPVRFPSGND